MAHELAADVLLLSAGLGTRLKPLTDKTPKPLIRVGNKPLIEYHLERLQRAGCQRVFVNTHHLADQFPRVLGTGSRWGLEIVYSYEDPILDSGGAIKKIEQQLRHSQLLTINSDTLVGADFPLEEFLQMHISREPSRMISISTRHPAPDEDFSKIGVSESGDIVEFLGESFGSEAPSSQVMFTGFSVVSRTTLQLMPEAGQVFSMTRDTWVRVLRAGHSIGSYLYNGYWNDVGTPERLAAAEQDFQAGRIAT